MLRATENETEKKLRGLKKENPNYDAMWSRIRLEADKRGSGWQEQTAAPLRKESPKKRWVMPVACAALAAVIALGTAASQGYLEQWIPDAKAAPLGQSIGAQAEVDGIILKVNSAVQGTDRSFGQDEAQERMMLDFSLSGFGNEDVRVAAFDRSSITDLDTGKKLELTMGDFNTNDVRSLDGWANSRTLNAISTVTGKFNQAEGLHRYRLEMSGLYMIKRATVPIEGKVKLGQEYTVLPEQDFKMKITDIQWDQKQGLMTMKFLPNENRPRLDTEDSSTLAMDRGNSISLKLGDQEIGAASWSERDEPIAGEETEASFNVSGLTEAQVADMTMTFHYAEPVRVVEGPWIVDFTLDPSKAEMQTETIPVQDASELTEQTGWTLGGAQLDAYGVTIPVDRNTAEPELKSKLQDGQIVSYSGISITDGEVTASGLQDPVPGLAINQGRENQQESIKFNIQSLRRNATANQMTYDFWDSYDFRNKPLTVTFDGAWIAHVDPDHWTPIGIPTEEEQTFADTLSDGTPIEYIVSRKGEDVLVELEVPEGVNLYEHTKLRVDGKDYTFDPFPLDYGSVRDQQGNYNYVDVYRNIPEGEKFEINMQAYGTIDDSKNATVVIRE